MNATISLTLAQETEFFNEIVIKKVYKEIMTTSDIIFATGGSTSKDDYQSLMSRYSRKSSGQIIAGGRHTPFLYYFPVSSLTSFIIKPYSCRLQEIANHYVSVEDANSIYRNYIFDIYGTELKIHFSDVFGLGTFTIDDKMFPFIIQRFSTGTKLTEIQSTEGRNIIAFLPDILKHLAKEGIIVDPYNRNWFIHGFSFDQRFLDNELLEYVDLAYMHSLDTNHKVKAIIEALRPLNY